MADPNCSRLHRSTAANPRMDRRPNGTCQKNHNVFLFFFSYHLYSSRATQNPTSALRPRWGSLVNLRPFFEVRAAVHTAREHGPYIWRQRGKNHSTVYFYLPSRVSHPPDVSVPRRCHRQMSRPSSALLYPGPGICNLISSRLRHGSDCHPLKNDRGAPLRPTGHDEDSSFYRILSDGLSNNII